MADSTGSGGTGSMISSGSAGGGGSGAGGGKDAQSLGNRLRKAVNMKKTRVQARIGAGKATKDMYAPQFRAQNERVKAYVDAMTEYSKVCGSMKESMLAYCRSSEAVGASLLAIAGAGFAREEFLATLEVLAHVWHDLDASRETLVLSIVDVSLYKANLFLKNYLLPARRAKEAYRDAVLQLSASESAVQNLLNAKVDKPADLLVAFTHRHYAERKSRVRLVDASNKMEDATSIKDPFLVEMFTVVMSNLGSFYGLASSSFGNLATERAKAAEFITAHRADVSAEIDRIEAQWKETQERERNNRFVPLTLLLASSELEYVSSIINVTSVDPKPTVERIIVILDAYSLALPLIRLATQQEVHSTLDYQTLFRTNSTSTKLLSAFTRIVGLPYLRELLLIVVSEIQSNKRNLEVDPSKAGEGVDVEESGSILISYCERIMDGVFDSLRKCPVHFRILASELREQVEAKFPGNGLVAVGGFFFLRFLCPALAAPDVNGLELDISPPARRACILIGKIIQNLSNGVEFAKETFMLPFNSFLSRYKPRMLGFQTALAQPLEHTDYVKLSTVERVNDAELPELQKFLIDNLEEIVEHMRTHGHAESSNQFVHVLGALDAFRGA